MNIIEEKLPPYGKRVMLCMKNGKWCFGFLNYTDKDGNHFTTEGDCGSTEVLGWIDEPDKPL